MRGGVGGIVALGSAQDAQDGGARERAPERACRRYVEEGFDASWVVVRALRALRALRAGRADDDVEDSAQAVVGQQQQRLQVGGSPPHPR